MSGRERFRRAEAAFRAATALSGGEREAFLERELGDDPALREQVRGMLRADERGGDVLDRPALGTKMRLADLVAAGAPGPAALPARIGRYEVVGVLGQGGMGTVYRAQQENPRRAVALKVVNAGAASAAALLRFAHEAQVLGRLQHPGIAQVFEAGVDDWGEGPQPYFAMELVVGVPLVSFAAQRRLQLPERLTLLARICDAVHHAHQKGVVHRDLKPANILVVEGFGESATGRGDSSHDLLVAQPKVLDFGVARVLDPEFEGRTLQTGVGQILGTLAYMSPEQASGAGAAVDIRSDIYSLGVVAHELLAGRLPHDLHHLPLAEALSVVREARPPHLGTLDRALRGDIETIVAKALEKEPSLRYASAAELAADLRRVVRGEPIHARRAGTVEQLVRLARRNRAATAAVALAACSLVAVTLVSLRMAALAEAGRAEEGRLRGLADLAAVEARREAYRARIAAAGAALGADDVVQARRELEAAPATERGWEWRHLQSRLDDSVLVATVGRPRTLAVTFSPDGSELVAAATVGSLHRWRLADLAAGHEERVDVPLPGDFRRRWANDLWFRDATTLQVVSRAAFVTLDAGSLAASASVDVPEPIFAIDRAGRYAAGLFGVDGDHAVVVRNIADRTRLVELCPYIGADPAVTFSDDGGIVAVCSADGGGLFVHSIAESRLLLHLPEVRGAAELAIDPAGRRVAVALLDGSAAIVAFDGSGSRLMLAGHHAPVSCVAFSPDGTRLATAADDRTVRLWSAADGTQVALLRGNDASPTDLAFAPDGTQLATACANGTVRLWNLVEPDSATALPTPQTVYGLAFSQDGTRLAAACLGGERPLRIWDAATARPVAALAEGYLSAVAFDGSGARLALGRSHGETTIVECGDGALLAKVSGIWWRTDWVAFDRDGTHLLALGNSGVLRRYDANDATLRRTVKLGGGTTNLGARAALSPDRSLLAAAIGSNVLLLDPSTFAEQGRLVGHSGRVHALAFSADGRRLASGGADQTIRIWDIEGRTTLATFEGSTAPILALAWSPDMARIASGGNDRTIRLWDAANGAEVARLHGHRSFVYCLAWSPDGSCLASGGGDDTVRLWDTRPLREVLEARQAGAPPAPLPSAGETAGEP